MMTVNYPGVKTIMITVLWLVKLVYWHINTYIDRMSGIKVRNVS